MTAGNMGDLSMTLTLKSRMEDEVKKIVDQLNKLDESGKKAQGALDKIRDSVSGVNGADGLKQIEKDLAKIGQRMIELRSEEVPDMSTIKKLETLSSGYIRVLGIMKEMRSQGIEGLNIFPNSVSKSANEAEIAYRKLYNTIQDISKLHGEGLSMLGVGATNNIRQVLSDLEKYKTTLDQIRSNGGFHPVAGYTASDITKSSGYVQALDDAKRYYKELKEAMRLAEEEEKRNVGIVENLIQQRVKARELAAQKEAEEEKQRQEQAKISAQIAQENAKSEIKWNEQKSKAFSEALRRQMQASVEAEKKGQVSLFANGFDTSVLEKRLAILNRMKEIQEKLEFYRPQLQYSWLDYQTSVKFGNANDPSIRHKEDDLQRLRNIVADLESEFNKIGGNDVFRNIDNQIKGIEQTIARLKDSAGSVNLGKLLGLENKSTDEFRVAKEAAMATEAHVKRQNELTAAFEKYFRVQEQVEAAEKRLAEATARTNQARREAIAASRQQAESLVRNRVKELEAQRKQLQELFGSGKSVLNTQELSQVQRAFSQITQEVNTLRSAMNNLGGYSIKDLFSIGRGTSDYTPMIGNMRTVIDQKQKAIELERQHRNELAATIASANKEAERMRGIIGDIKSLFLQGGLVFGAQQFFNSIVQTGGEIVQQHIALRSIIGDVQKADELFSQTQQLALQSPFKFGELNRDVKQLAAFGVEASELYDTTKRLADISSGLGVSFERLGLAYGQVKARSWLDGKELRQFAYAGLPLLQKITDLYNTEGKNGRRNYTNSDVKKMITNRQVSFEDVQKVLWQMTNEGGQFYNMQFVLSETLLGKWNKLIDAWDIMLGKFAEGRSVIGGTFKYAIDGTTALVQTLDKISPVLLSLGAVSISRMIGRAAMSGIGINSLQRRFMSGVNEQLKIYAIKQQEAVVDGKITQQLAQQNVFKRASLLSDRQSQQAAYNRMAIEGKLSVLQMQTLVGKKQLSVEIIKQLALMGQITARQEQIILGGSRMAAVWSGATTKLGGMMSFFGGWWGLAITGITSLFLGYSQWSDKVKEDEKSLVDGARQRSKNYGEFLNGLGNKGDVDLSTQVESMKDILQNSNDYTDSIKEQVENAYDLSEQYDILKEKIKEAKEVNDELVNKYGPSVNNATASTGLENDSLFELFGLNTPGWLKWLNGLGNDSIEKNAEDAQTSLQKYQVMFDELDTNTKTKMQDFINALISGNAELSRQIKGLPIAEQVRMLAAIGGDDWERFVDRFVSGSEMTQEQFKELSDRAKESSGDISEIMYDDIPKALDSVRKDLGMSQDQFKEWAKKNPVIFASMMDKIAQKANITSKTILYYFHSAISELMNMDFWPSSKSGGGKKKYRTGLEGFSKMIFENAVLDKTLTGKKKKGKFWVSEYVNALKKVQAGTYEETGKNIQSKLKDARNELDMQDTAAKKLSSKRRKAFYKSSDYLKAKREYELWSDIAKHGGVSDDLGKNKVTGNYAKEKGKNLDAEASKADREHLRALQARLKLIKDAYSMYKQYYEMLHDEKEASRIVADRFKDQGLSNDDVAKIRSEKDLLSLVQNYISRVRAWTPKRPQEMKDSKDAAISEGVKETDDIRYRAAKEALDDYTNATALDLDMMTKQWDAFQKVLASTGDYDLAAEISGISKDKNAIDRNIYPGGRMGSEYVSRFSDFLRNYLDSVLSSSGRVGGDTILGDDYDRVAGMTDKQIEKYAGSLLSKSAPQKIEGFVNALKKLRDLMTNTEYKDGIETYTSLIEKVITQTAQIARNKADFENAKSKIMAAYSNGTIDKEQKNDALSIASAIMNDKDLKASDAYRQFMDQITSMTENAARNMRDRIFANLDEQYAKGLISASDYANGIQKVNDQMEAFMSRKSSAQALLTGGLEGFIKNRKQKIQDKIRADMENGGGEYWGLDPETGKFGLTKKGKKASEGAAKKASTLDFVGSIIGSANENIQSYKKLEETWTNAFGDGLKNSGFSRFMDGLMDVSGGVQEAWSSLLKGDFVGTLDGVLNTFTGWFSWGNAAKNRSYEKQAEYLKNIQATVSDINNNVKKRMSSEGGSKIQSLGETYKGNLQNEAAEVRETYYRWSQAHTLHKNHRNRMYTNLDYKQINDYLRSIGYDGESVRSDTIQNLSGEWLSKIRERFAGMWAKIPQEAKDYLNRLIEIEGETGEITDMTSEIIKSLTGLNKDELRSEYKDLLNDLNSDNEDFADSFEKHLRDAILSGMTSNLYKSAIDDLVKKAAESASTTSGYYVDKNGNTKKHTGGDDSADTASEYTQEEYEALKRRNAELAEKMRDTRDMLKELYGWSDSGSSSMRSSAVGITEQAADYIASYLNAARADVSVIRQLEGVYFAKFDVTTLAQLEQLTMISENTLRNADAAVAIQTAVFEIKDMINKSQSGIKPIYVNVK